MAHNSPAVYLVWSILVITLFAFLIYHLWMFDRLGCLAWNSTGGNGTFKRIMTYTYLTSIPLLLIYAVGLCYIKYAEGYVVLPQSGIIIPKPVEMWSKTHKRLTFPLQLCFSFAWSLEIVTHLEELCFWLFLLHTTNASPWFRSPHFIVWAIGSCVALAGLPSVTIYLKDDVNLCEAWTFLTGSVGSLILTVLFCPVLFRFPNFLRNIREEGVEPCVMVRLTKFQSLNITRVVCRFFFVVPLLIMAVDAVREWHFVLTNSFASDLLAMVGGFGCVISSMITLLIFFPRSYEHEAGYRYRERPMTELWSDDDEKIQLPGGMDSDYNRTTAHRGDMVSQTAKQDHSPYAYRARYDSTSLESSPNNNLKARFDDDAPVPPQRSSGSLLPSPAPVSDPRDRPYMDQTDLPSPPLPRPEKSNARRSRAPVWEVVSTEQDESQGYYVGGPDGAVVGRDLSTGVANLSRGRSSKSNLHPILQHFSSPINVFDVQRNCIMEEEV